jgi:hypothetical protein
MILALGLAAVFVLLGFVTTGGFDGSVTVSGGNTWVEIVATLLGAAAAGALVVRGERLSARAWAVLLLLIGLSALTALSILWSVQPDASWQAADLAAAYLMVFVLGLVLARLVPRAWPVLVIGLGTAAVILSAYGLLAKVFPGSLAASQIQGRLQAPLGYWNATGELAAIGLLPCLWAFTRRPSSRVLAALAVPGVVILASVVVLSFSRTALVAAILAVAAWLVFVPGRLRASALLGLAAPGTAVVCLWALSHKPLITDGASLAARTADGHPFGLVLLVVVVLSVGAGLLAAFPGKLVELSEPARRRVGKLLIGGASLLPVLALVALALSSRGLTGEISSAWHSLTSVNTRVSTGASRLTQFGSTRPLYWSEGITVGEHALLRGVGALGYAVARTRYTTSPADVGHAHSYLVQTFADLGLLGLVTSLALGVAWLIGAGRTLAVRRRWRELEEHQRGERAGLVVLALVVGIYAVLSCTDWTYYFPAVTVPVVLAAGWLTGRGPIDRAPESGVKRPPILARPGVAAAVTVLACLGLLAAWAIWQPLRSSQEATDALVAASRGQGSTAFNDAHAAVSSDPLALQPRFVLSSLLEAAGERAAARNELVSAIREQPQNFDSWLQLGYFDLGNHEPRRALFSLEQARRLYPTSFTTGVLIGQAQAALKR